MIAPQPTPRFIRNPAVLFSGVGNDVVALHVDRGECFGLQDVTADVWELLAEPIGIDGICSALCNEYEVDEGECRTDIAALLSELHAKNLIIAA